MADLLTQLEQRLSNYNMVNSLMGQYYEGTTRVFNPNISTPPVMRHIRTVVGWPGTCVDVLEERLDFLGWDDDGDYGLGELYLANNMSNESSMANLDALIYGAAYFSITTGDGDLEPPALINAESPLSSYGLWNQRTRLLDVGYTKYANEQGQFVNAAVYEPMKTTYYARSTEASRWVQVRTDNHRLGRCQLVRITNRGRAGRMGGRSEITQAVRSYTNTAVRTLIGMETNREFFSAPQRYVLGAKDDAFVDQDGNVIPGWKAVLGSLWNLQRDAEWAEQNGGDGLAQVGQFPINPPGPFLEQIRGLSMLLAAEVGMPSNYLGMTTDNPPSADSIRALEARLVKRAERRQDGFDPGYTEIGIVAAKIAGNGTPKPSDIETMWRDAATPTKAADATRAQLLVASGVLPPESQVAYEMAGLTPRQIRSLEEYKADASKQAAKDALKQAALNNLVPNQPPAPGVANAVPNGQATQPGNAATSKSAVGNNPA